jgi:HlyD family secretion protein
MKKSASIQKYRKVVGVTALVSLGLVVWSLRWWEGPEVPVERVVQREFVQSVVASGHVETPHRVGVGSQITGTVLRVPVAEGQRVAAGDLLVELEAAELLAAQRQADIAVIQAQARLRQLQELQAPVAEQQLRQAQASSDVASAQFKRSQELFQQGFIGAATLDESRKVAALADAQQRLSQKQLESLRPAGSDAALAQAALAQAQASADVARARAAYTRIKAPSAGTLIARNVEVGDVVQPGKQLLTLSPSGRVQLVVAIDERNLRLIALGQPALASADAYPERRFAAVLAYINPGVNVQTGAVEVKLDVSGTPAVGPPSFLSQDMTVSVDIEVARRQQTLLLPVAALRDGQSAEPWVLRLESGRAVRREVRLGLRSGGAAEVLAGLQAGDVVVNSALVLPGARVRAAPDATKAAP